jgi:hypothetical protein
MENFIYETMLKDVSVCDELIEYHKNNVYEKMRGLTSDGTDAEIKKSTDVIVAWTQHPTIQKYVQQLSGKLIEYLEKYSLKGRIKIGLKESFNIQHYAPNEGYFAWHCERTTTQSWQRGLVWMTYLNDVDDGGETEFFYQKLKVKPVKGKCVIWPTDFTHLHRGITSPTQHKYIVTGWFNFYDTNDTERDYKHYISLNQAKWK